MTSLLCANKGNISMQTLTVKTDQLVRQLIKPLDLSLSQFVDDDIIKDILLDWGEALARLENMALRIEADPDDGNALAEIRRTLHTIKGDSAVCGLSKVSDVFHQVEDLLEGFIEEGACPANMLLQIKDWLQQILKTIASGAGQIELPDSPDKGSEKKGPQDWPSQEQSRVDAIFLKILIAEDDLTSCFLLQKLLQDCGSSHVAINGKEAVEAVRIALEANEPYDLICLDVMMPEMDGQAALREIRGQEEARGITSSSGSKIIMTTALDDLKNVSTAYGSLCDAYLVKPIDKGRLMEELRKLELIA
jgi:two-component system chemotaxis response regulator CheY